MVFKLLLPAFLPVLSGFAQPGEWPVLKRYDSDHLYNIALPLGGIGTGTVSLGGRGELRDWEIMNKPAKGFSTVTAGNDAPFFAIYVKQDNGMTRTKALIGPLDDMEYHHKEGRAVNHHGLPRFTSASFDAAYPFGQVNLSDKNLPVKVRIRGFNPLIPGNADDSGIPIAVLTYEVANLTEGQMEVSVCGNMRNFIGRDGSRYRLDWKGDKIFEGAANNINEYRESGSVKGIFMYSDGVSKTDPAWGTIALITTGQEDVTYRRSSAGNAWARAILDFWDDFSADGRLTDKEELVDDDPMASLAVTKRLMAGETASFNFFITWNFPNRFAWSKERVGNYYSTQYADAWDVALKTIPRIGELEDKTICFVKAVVESSYPDEVKEAALFNLNSMRSQTVFRLPDGHMMGWEGVMDDFGSCMGSCTHVWNYEQATAFLFNDLARTMRDIEFNYSTGPSGFMSFRTSLPLANAQASHVAAADGQLGTIMKFYRDWQLSGDNVFLEDNWEMVKRVLSFAWIDGGWDADQDGVMEGCQHNTMDVEYYGPNPQMQFWYLGALRAAEEMAMFLKDKDFERKCNRLFRDGSRWTDENLFNGEYYIQKIMPPSGPDAVAPGLTAGMGTDTSGEPGFQLGEGCLVDQLVGQMMAHICGLGYLASPDNIRTTLRSIMKYNYLEDFSDHFNNMRTYVAGNESGLLMASWPKGRLEVPFPYFTEAMTGFEYTAAIGMLYEGESEDGLKCIRSIRERFNGRKRNPFNEPECGHHYARAMTSWAAINALSGFHYSAVNKTMSFAGKSGNYFWTTGSAWGTCKIEGNRAELTVISGEISLNSFGLRGAKVKKLNNKRIAAGQNLVIET